MGNAADEVLVELDERRRVYLSKVGRSTDRRYLVRSEPDGTMIFTPATVVPTRILQLQAYPEVLAAIRYGQEHPEDAVELELPDVPDVDWENAD